MLKLIRLEWKKNNIKKYIWKAACITAIVTSVIIAALTQGNIGDATLAGSIPFYALLMILAVLSVCISICHAETRDLR